MEIFCQQKLAYNDLPAETELLLIAVGAGAKANAVPALDHARLPDEVAEQLQRAAQARGFAGRADEQLCLHFPRGKKAPLGVALLGLGNLPAEPEGATWVRLGGRAVRLAMAQGARQAVLVIAPPAREAAAEKRALQQCLWLAQGLVLGAYQNVTYKSAPKAGARPRPAAPVRFGLGAPASEETTQALRVGEILAESVILARELVNAPAGELGPPEYADKVRALSRTHKLRCKVLDERQLAAEGMHLHLGVGQGSDRPPRLVHVQYDGAGAGDAESVALIGKGITFDSGGLCLKPADSMATMKMDMGGSAAVLGTLVAASRMGLPVRLHGVLALAENMPSGKALRPGDVLTSAAGKTVEVNNTDAEGRLVLADAITWTQRHLKPDLLVDVATLTGACMVALGPKTTGLFSNHETLAAGLQAAARDAGEDTWRLPLTPGLRDQLKSDVADMRNTGERLGGAITAGLFLQDFVEGTPWAHLDIAGPAWATDEGPHYRRGGTGAACATLVRWLMRLASGERVGTSAGGGAKAGRAASRGGARKDGATATAAPDVATAASRRARTRGRGGRDR